AWQWRRGIASLTSHRGAVAPHPWSAPPPSDAVPLRLVTGGAMVAVGRGQKRGAPGDMPYGTVTFRARHPRRAGRRPCEKSPVSCLSHKWHELRRKSLAAGSPRRHLGMWACLFLPTGAIQASLSRDGSGRGLCTDATRTKLMIISRNHEPSLPRLTGDHALI